MSDAMKCLVLLISFLSVFSASASADIQRLKTIISEQLGLQTYLIKATPIPGLYAINTNQGVVYSDLEGKFVIQGIMLDMSQKMNNLTIQMRREHRKLAIEQIEAPMILLDAPKRSHLITLFADQSCASCRRVIPQLPRLKAMGIAIQILPAVNANNVKQTRRQWCNRGPDNDFPLRDHLPSDDCDEILASHVGLSEWLGIKVLPSWIMPDGELVHGYQSPEQLLRKLDLSDESANSSSSARG